MTTSDFFSLEITDNAIKIFDGDIGQKDIDVKNIALVDLPFSFFSSDLPNVSQKVADIVKNTLTALKITKKKANIIIPDTYTYSQIFEMPILNEKELISAIKYQADQFIPLPIDEINIDLEVINNDEKNKKLSVLVVAAPKKLIDKIEELVEFSSLIPNRLENQLSAFGRFIEKFAFFFSKINSSKIAFINLGFTNSSIYLFDQSKSLIYKIHSFNLGFNLFIKELKINTLFDDNKIKEILQSFSPGTKNPVDVELILSPLIKQFIFEIKKIVLPEMNLFLIGESFRFPALPSIFAKSLNASISLFNPSSLLKPNPQIENYRNSLSLFISTFGGLIE